MSDLHLIFIAAGIILFGLVVLVSYIQQRKSGETTKSAPDSALDAVSNKDTEINVETGRSGKIAPALEENEVVGDAVSASLASPEQKTQNVLSSMGSKIENKIEQLTKGKKASFDSSNADAVDSQNSEPVMPEAETSANNEPQLDEEIPQERAVHALLRDEHFITTELVAKVLNPDPIEQTELLSLFREHDFKFQRGVHIYGLNELTDLWRDIEFELPSARFLELGISIQLCDRDGAISQRESHDFQQMVYQFCERFDAPFEFSIDLDSAVAQGQALDRIARRYDSMAVLNVVPKSNTGFRMADIQSCARDLMMSTDKNGIYLKTKGQKNNITILYRLACTDGEGHFGIQGGPQVAAPPVHDLVLYMKVPSTPEPESIFQQMVSDANDLATWLDGKVVDRSGKAMTQRTYASLMQQVSDIAYSMNQDGITPGDAVTKKLF